MKPENRPKTVFEGREYDDYQATQMQRRIERTIRKQKRLKTAYEAAGLTKEAQVANIRLRRLNEKYRQFSKAAGLPEQRERMRVLNNITVSLNESDTKDFARRTAKSLLQNGKVVGFSGLPKEMRQQFRESLAKATPEAKKALRRVYAKADYILGNEKRSYYSGGFLQNVIHIGANASPSTIAHELFHKLDTNHKISQTFTESLSKDYAVLNALSGGNIKEYLAKKYPEAFRMSRRGIVIMKEEYRGIADILNGFSRGKIYYGFGHSEKYWMDAGALEAEAWTQFGRIQFCNHSDVLKLFSDIFPNFEKRAIIALKELI